MKWISNPYQVFFHRNFPEPPIFSVFPKRKWGSWYIDTFPYFSYFTKSILVKYCKCSCFCQSSEYNNKLQTQNKPVKLYCWSKCQFMLVYSSSLKWKRLENTSLESWQTVINNTIKHLPHEHTWGTYRFSIELALVMLEVGCKKIIPVSNRRHDWGIRQIPLNQGSRNCSKKWKK